MIVLYGAGAMAREIVEMMIASNLIGHLGGFIVDEGYGDPGDEIAAGKRILGHAGWLDSHRDAVVYCAVGDPFVRMCMASIASSRLGKPIMFGMCGSTCAFGHGSIIAMGSMLTADVVVGPNVYIHSGCIVSHDCVIGAHSVLSPGVTLCGGVEIGIGAMIGAGATVKPGVSIGKWATVGLGAAVIRDVGDYETVVGVPARPIDI